MKTQVIAGRLGLVTCLEFDPSLLVPEERIRAYCVENKCGNYGRNYSCPPHVGTVEELSDKLKEYSNGLLLQYSKPVDVKGDPEEVMKTKNEFHRKVLRLQRYMNKHGIERTWGMIGGNCGLCHVCRVTENKPCRHPDKSRMSLEAAGIDVIALLDKLDLDSEFHPDRITWTGCILY